MGLSGRCRRSMAAALGALALSGCVIGGGDAVGPSEPRVGDADSAAGTVPVTVRESPGGVLVFVDVTIGGEGPHTFLVDTGASTSAIDDDLVEELGLEETGQTAQLSGVIGDGSVRLYTVEQWSIGDFALEGETIGAVDLGGAAEGSGAVQFSGLLGSDQLSRFGAVTIDYAGQTMTFSAGQADGEGGGGDGSE